MSTFIIFMHIRGHKDSSTCLGEHRLGKIRTRRLLGRGDTWTRFWSIKRSLLSRDVGKSHYNRKISPWKGKPVGKMVAPVGTRAAQGGWWENVKRGREAGRDAAAREAPKVKGRWWRTCMRWGNHWTFPGCRVIADLLFVKIILETESHGRAYAGVWNGPQIWIAH